MDQINHSGGINGRTINPIVTSFDPASESGMRAVCKDWTQGSPAVFAVLDGLGTYTGDNELCVTQEGMTPLLSQWTTVSNWTAAGSPYLWWTGRDDASILQATVSWGHEPRPARPVAQGGRDRRGPDQRPARPEQYLLPDLKKIGVTPLVVTLPAEPGETATTDSQAPLISGAASSKPA